MNDGTAPLRFDGPDVNDTDVKRLTHQHERLFELMSDGVWRSLPVIAHRTGDPEASISAQLRHLRKPRFGGHTVDRRRSEGGGLWEYRLTPATGTNAEQSSSFPHNSRESWKARALRAEAQLRALRGELFEVAT